MLKCKWIYNGWVDGLFILGPPFFCFAAVLLFPEIFNDSAEVSIGWWIALVLLIDVAHVYSTLYRTYIDKEIVQQHKMLLFGVPFLIFVAGAILHSTDPLWYWRVMAYLAVFHFIRQQYGFMRIYSRNEMQSNLFKWIDTISIYALPLLPVISWHFSGERNFHWFVKGDFIMQHSQLIAAVCNYTFFAVTGVFIGKEIFNLITKREFNLPKFLLAAGTGLSWYGGIVWKNSDLTFTLFNVVSHGIPYMALVWIYGRKKNEKGLLDKGMKIIFSVKGILVFLGIIFLFAFLEEGLWDRLVWQDHHELFSFLDFIPALSKSGWLSIMVPLLSLPQVTHYVIDGFIWKIKEDKFGWKEITLGNNEPAASRA